MFNLYAEHIMRNSRLDELQAGIKTGRRNNNLRYADDTVLMAESKEELKSLLMRVKEESERASLRLNIKKPKIMASAHHCMGNRKGNGGNTDRFSLLGLQNHCRW